MKSTITPVSNYTENIVFLRWQMSRMVFLVTSKCVLITTALRCLIWMKHNYAIILKLADAVTMLGLIKRLEHQAAGAIEKRSLTKEVQSRRQKVQTSSCPLQVGKVSGFKVLPRSDFRGPLHPSMLTILSRCIVERMRTWGRATSRCGTGTSTENTTEGDQRGAVLYWLPPIQYI